MRTMSISGTVVAILTWLLRIGEEPPASDLLIITGVKKNLVRALFSPLLVLIICCFNSWTSSLASSPAPYTMKAKERATLPFTLFSLHVVGLKVTHVL